MLFWWFITAGTRVASETEGEGEFYCPGCRRRRHYFHKRAQKQFTLYFLPVTEYGDSEEYVECATCQRTYTTEVLRLDLEASAARFEAEFEKVMKKVLAYMAAVDGDLGEEEIETVQRVFEQITGTTVSKGEVQKAGLRAFFGPYGFLRKLKSLALTMNDPGRELVIRAGLVVAAADGKLDKKEGKFLEEIGKALGMTPAHVRGVISTFLEEARSK